MDIDERQALITFFNETGGDEWRRKDSWCTDAPLGEWYGVKTNNEGSVVEINLDCNGLIGAIPLEVKALKKLEVLDLRYNNLRGTIPAEISQAKSLNYIDLSNNQLSGAIPLEVKALKKLEDLDLSYNNLRGTIPAEISQAKSLKYIDLSNNQLSGAIPSEVGKLPDPQYLDLSSNQLSGTIPVEICQAESLETINLANNQLSGTIPVEICQAKSLWLINLANNQLSGTIPVEICQSTSLQTINLANNQLSGAIPSEVGKLPDLQHLDLSSNQLSGTIPVEIFQAMYLGTINLANNQLSGAIPSEVGKVPDLRHLDLSSNQLSGTIPVGICQADGLTTIDLSKNQLSGVIPPELGRLFFLQNLDLSSNQLSGTIPAEMSQTQDFRTINLAGNMLSEPMFAGGFWGNIFGGLRRWLSGRSSTDAAQGEHDVSHQGFQEKGTSAGGDKSTISVMKPQPEKGEGVEEAKSSGKSRREGKVGDQSSEIKELRDYPGSLRGSRKEGKAEEKSSEIVLPKSAQEQPADEKIAGEVKLDKESNPPEEREQTILAECLGTKATIYRDPSSGVQLILEDGSLEEEIKKEVVVKREIRYITCSNKRDTSRTHEELLAWASDDGIEELTFLAMPIIHGPSEAVFSPNKPARLRFFAGYSEDIQHEIKDEGGDDYSNDAVKGYLRKIYEPLVSADGINWRMLPPFEVDFVLSQDDGEQVWLETQLYHFSEGAIGKLIPKLSDARLPKSDYRDYSTFQSRMPWLKRLMNRESVILGNATKDDLIFYACKKEDTVACERRMAVGVGAGGATVTGEKGQNTTNVSHGIDDIVRCKIKAGRYTLVEMPKEGNWVQTQILCAVFKPEKAPGKSQSLWSQYFLIKRNVSKGWVFATLPEIINDWRSERKDPTKRLDYNASLRKVKEFLLDH